MTLKEMLVAERKEIDSDIVKHNNKSMNYSMTYKTTKNKQNWLKND